MRREFIKGNEAIVKGAILAGCTHFFGYPITPASEIVHTAAALFPKLGYSFLQAESEVAAINMAYGAAGAGKRVLTASSSPGMSLKQEGVSYIAAAELPCVIVDIMRSGPGLGNIWPEQSDYNQIVKGGGHGNYKCIVLAPNSPQEMCDMTIEAFELADKYLTPVYLLADGYIGQVMEPVTFPKVVKKNPDKSSWAVMSNKETKKNLICSIRMTAEEMEDLNLRLQKKYEEIEENEVRFQEYMIDDAEFVVVAYGISARLSQSAVDELRGKGIKIGLFRPQTLFPFPKKRLMELSDQAKLFSVVELSNGQMVDDVKLTLNGKRPVEFYGRMGGSVPTHEEITKIFEEQFKKHLG